MSDFGWFLFWVLGGIVLGAAAFGGWFLRRRVSHAKDIERSLKLVPLMLKLPPADDDENQRDEREKIKENVSRAEGIYTLLSGIATNRRFLYSQRHISFEIVAHGEQIFFYVAVPVSLVTSVEKALVSAYPAIQIIPTEDHNIFSETGKISTVAGGEMQLSNDSYYPLQTYKTLEFDPLTGILSGLTRLKPDEGIALQIMMRPANPKWAKKARLFAKGLLNPQRARMNDPMHVLGSMARAPLAPPDWQAKEQMQDPTKQADSIDQKLAQSVEEKAAQPAYETLIRIVTSSTDLGRSRMLVQDMVNGFAQFALPGSNSLQFVDVGSPQKLASDMIFRFFPTHKKRMILTSSELATLYHLPSSSAQIGTPLERKGLKEVAAPAEVPSEGLVLGSNFFQGKEKVIRLTDKDRTRHMYILGQTGTGKSVLLEDLMVQDMMAGKGMCFIDPHGETANTIMSKIPPHRAEDVIYFNPADAAMPLGLNILETDIEHPEQKDFMIQETINMLYKLYDPDHQGFIGPRFEQWYRNSAMTVMADPNGATFLEIPKPFLDDDFLKAKFKYVTDPTVQDFWINEMGQTSERDKSEMLGYFVSKWGAFQSNAIMRNIMGQHKSAFNFGKVMDEGKILIVNLSKGQVGELNAKYLGMIFVIKILAAALARSGRPAEELRQFTLYVDEFQNFSTDSFATILSEARKYNLCLIVANQFIGQLSEDIKGAVFGNVGTLFTYRCGPEDAEFLEKQFKPSFSATDLTNLPNLTGAVKLMANGLPTTAFTLKPIFPPLGTPDAQTAMAIKELSRQKFGRPKDEVDAEVAKALTMRDPVKK